MFEFDLTLGPLHLHIALGPEPAGEYVELGADTELVVDDEDAAQDRIGFRGN
jgi:hypothetical protein